MAEIAFFSKQQLIALRNKGLIDPEDIDQYIARDGYQTLRKVLAEHEARGGDRRGEDLGHPRPRRRRLPGRRQVGVGPQGRAGAQGADLRHLQRRRGRPRRLHGPQHHGDRPAHGDRGHDHRRLRGRRARGLHLRPQGVPAGAAPPAHRHRPGARARPARREHPRHRLLPSTSRSTAAPAPSSAASRRR